MTPNRLRILSVDDDDSIRMIVTMALHLDPSIEARSVGSGAEALALLDTRSWIPDLLLLDVNMPEMTGPELLAIIREQWHHADLPAIFVTARAGKAALAEYDELDVLGVVIKPFVPTELASHVRGMFDGSLSARVATED